MKDFLERWLQIFPRGTLGEGMGTLPSRSLFLCGIDTA